MIRIDAFFLGVVGDVMIMASEVKFLAVELGEDSGCEFGDHFLFPEGDLGDRAQESVVGAVSEFVKEDILIFCGHLNFSS